MQAQARFQRPALNEHGAYFFSFQLLSTRRQKQPLPMDSKPVKPQEEAVGYMVPW